MFKQSAGLTAPDKYAFETLNPEIPSFLPHNEIFNIKVQNTDFPLSGASLSSDGPSYFTVFFEQYLSEPAESRPVLRIDRSAEIFKLISAHLQGYYVGPKDDCQLFHLYSDVLYYRLPRFEKMLLREDILTRIGSKQFAIPRSIFSSPGDLPNYFSLGFTGLFSHPRYTVPGGGSKIMRPPPMRPPSVSERSATSFAQLLEILSGAPVEVRNRAHREHLLRECRYFHFRGLEQKIVAHRISYNAFRKDTEITILLQHTSSKGTSINEDEVEKILLDSSSSKDTRRLIQIKYARPFIAQPPLCLIIQVESEHVIWKPKETEDTVNEQDLWEGRLNQEEYKKLFDILKPVFKVVESLCNKQGIEAPSLQEEYPVAQFSLENSQLNIDSSTSQERNDEYQEPFDLLSSNDNTTTIKGRKRVKLWNGETRKSLLYVTSAQYRVHMMVDFTIVLEGIVLNAYSREKSRNAQQEFLV